MAFRPVEQIVVGANPPGYLFNGAIYSFNCNFGSSDSPSQVTINVVSNDGTYTIFPPSPINKLRPYGSLSATDPVPIKILATPKPLIFPSMYLTSYSIDESVGQRLLSLTFQDRSMILDKVQISLLNRDAKISLSSSPANRNTIYLNGRPLESMMQPNDIFQFHFLPKSPQSVSIPIICPPCDPFEKETQNKFIERKDYLADQGWLFKIDPQRGGIIVLGKEEYTSSPCNLPDVTYNFKELVDILHKIGLFGRRLSPEVALNGAPTNFEGITDRGKLELRRNYSGSLREVLNNWARDFGYGVFWNPLEDHVQGTDLQTHSIDLQGLKNSIRNLRGRARFSGNSNDAWWIRGENEHVTQSAIGSLSESYSLDGTYQQDQVSTLIKPGRIVDHKKTRYFKRNFRNIKLSEVIPCSKFGGRNEDELLVSCGLSKFNEEARTLYNWMKLRNCVEADVKNEGVGKIEPLGLTIYHVLEGSEKEAFMNLAYGNIVSQGEVAEKFGEDCKVYIGNYNEELESRWVDWERKVADFIGKYYIIDKEREDQFLCLPTTKDNKAAEHLYEYKFKMTTTPSTREYSKNSKHDLPFEEILKHPEGANIKLTSNITRELEDGKILMFQRSTAWGVKKEEMDDLFLNENDESILGKYIPAAEKVEGVKLSYIKGLICNDNPALKDVCDKLEKDLLSKKIEPVFVFAPSFDSKTTTFTFDITDVVTDINKYEKKPENPKEKQEECGMVCDVDLIEELCEKQCPNQETRSQPSTHGLVDQQARQFTIMVEDRPTTTDKVTKKKTTVENKNKGGTNQKELIFPSESDYEGWLTFDTGFRRAVDGVSNIYGTVTNAGETLNFQFNKVDIAGDLDDLQEAGIKKNLLIVPKTEAEIRAGVTIDENGKLTNILEQDPVSENKLLTARAYHNIITMTNTSNKIPSESLSVSMAGLDFTAFQKYMDPKLGWQSISISVDENGSKCDLTFGTKPKELPEQDVLLNKVSTKLRMNTFGRTY